MQEIVKKNNTWNIRRLVDELFILATQLHIEDWRILGELFNKVHWNSKSVIALDSWRPHEMVKGKRKKIKRSYFLLRRCNFSLAAPIYIHLKRMMFFNVPFFVSNQDGLNGCYYTSWIAQWIEIISEIAFLIQPDTVAAVLKSNLH